MDPSWLRSRLLSHITFLTIYRFETYSITNFYQNTKLQPPNIQNAKDPTDKTPTNPLLAPDQKWPLSKKVRNHWKASTLATCARQSCFDRQVGGRRRLRCGCILQKPRPKTQIQVSVRPISKIVPKTPNSPQNSRPLENSTPPCCWFRQSACDNHSYVTTR